MRPHPLYWHKIIASTTSNASVRRPIASLSAHFLSKTCPFNDISQGKINQKWLQGAFQPCILTHAFWHWLRVLNLLSPVRQLCPLRTSWYAGRHLSLDEPLTVGKAKKENWRSFAEHQTSVGSEQLSSLVSLSKQLLWHLSWLRAMGCCFKGQRPFLKSHSTHSESFRYHQDCFTSILYFSRNNREKRYYNSVL